ncbi:hypothetical protein AC1031_017489 [Aphanomyces cochlioides]|nr:hypothetical protein AC1031_017489 [Aphanomyces cochlioides]
MELISDTRMLQHCVRTSLAISGVKTIAVAFGSGNLMDDCIVTAQCDGDEHFSQIEISTPKIANAPNSNKKSSADSKVSPLHHGFHSRHATFLANYFNQHPAKTVKLGSFIEDGDMVQLFEDIFFPEWSHRTALKACGDGPLPAKGQFPPAEGTNTPPQFVFKPTSNGLADTLATLVEMRVKEFDVKSEVWLNGLRHVAQSENERGLLTHERIRTMVRTLMDKRNRDVLVNLVKKTSDGGDINHPNPDAFVSEYEVLDDLGFVIAFE